MKKITIYVYLIISQNRFVITKTKMQDEDYWYYFSTTGFNENILTNLAKTFCCAFISGQQYIKKVVNSMLEFE